MKTIFLLTTLFCSLLYAAPKEVDRQFQQERNFLSNPGFENGKAGWTAATGTFTVSSGVMFGGQAGVFDATATGGYIQSDLVTVEAGARANRCSAEFDYIYSIGNSGDYVVKIFKDATEILSTPLPVTPTDRALPISVDFECPSLVGEKIQLKIESTLDAGPLTMDQAFLGYGRNSVSVSQSELIAEAHYPGTPACVWARNGVGFSTFSPDADCPSIIQTAGSGVVDTANDNKPNIVISDAKPGVYTVVMKGHQTYSAALSFTASNAMWDSVSGSVGPVCDAKIWQNSTNGNSTLGFTCTKTVTVPTTQDLTFEIYAQETAAGTLFLNNENPAFTETTFTVTKNPIEVVTGRTYLTSGEYWSLDVGGASIDMNGGASFGTPTPLSNPNLNLIVNPGSKEAQIPCSGTNPPTGSTCAAGNEHVGAVIEISTAGRYRVCGQFEHRLDVNGPTGAQETSFEWVETPSDSETVLQTAPQSNAHALIVASSLSGRIFDYKPFNLCGDFTFSSAGQKTLRLFYQQSVTGTTPNSSFLFADRSPGLGDRSVEITIDKLDQQMPAPVFPGFTSALNEKLSYGQDNIRQCAGQVQTIAGVGTLIRGYGACVASISSSATGDYTVNWLPGTFSSIPSCIVAGQDNQIRAVVVVSPLNDSLRVRMNLIDGASGAFTDANSVGEGFHYNCTGFN